MFEMKHWLLLLLLAVNTFEYVRACTDPNCIVCEDPNVCTGCPVGYRIDSGACQACTPTNCAECVSDAATCTTCLGGYSLIGGQCPDCSDVEAYCKLKAVDGGGACICAACHDTQDTNYILANNRCYKCDDSALDGQPGCVECHLEAGKIVCDVCGFDKYLVDATTATHPGITFKGLQCVDKMLDCARQCLACDDGVMDCDNTANLQQCSSCRHGYGWNKVTNACEGCGSLSAFCSGCGTYQDETTFGCTYCLNSGNGGFDCSTVCTAIDGCENYGEDCKCVFCATGNAVELSIPFPGFLHGTDYYAGDTCYTEAATIGLCGKHIKFSTGEIKCQSCMMAIFQRTPDWGTCYVCTASNVVGCESSFMFLEGNTDCLCGLCQHGMILSAGRDICYDENLCTITGCAHGSYGYNGTECTCWDCEHDHFPLSDYSNCSDCGAGSEESCSGTQYATGTGCECTPGCNPGYARRENECIDCTTLTNCDTLYADSSGTCKCSTCSANYQAVPDQTECKDCSAKAANCARFGIDAIDNVCLCIECNSGHLPDSSGICISCDIANCATEVLLNDVCSCSDCDAGFLVNAAGDGCISCSITNCDVEELVSDICKCDTCASGSLLNAAADSCISCTPANCQLSGLDAQENCTCITCDANTLKADLSPGCIPCQITDCTFETLDAADTCKCDTCSATYLPSTNGQSCVFCDPLNCDTPGLDTLDNCLCAACSGSNYWDGSSCTPCSPPNCDSFTTNNAELCECDVCTDPYLLTTEKQCQLCDLTNCDTHILDGSNDCQCLTCDSGSLKFTNGSCIPCAPANCATPSLSPTAVCECDLCSSGYLPNSAGDCQSCTIANCDSEYLDGSDNCKCNPCSTNYLLNNNGDGCIECNPTGCGSPALDVSEQCICQVCSGTYYLQGTSCIECDPPNCATPVTNNVDTCTCSDCVATYLVSSTGTCIECDPADCQTTALVNDVCTCDLCNAGRYWNATSQLCEICDINNCNNDEIDVNGTCVCTECAATYDLSISKEACLEACDLYQCQTHVRDDSDGCQCSDCNTGYDRVLNLIDLTTRCYDPCAIDNCLLYDRHPVDLSCLCSSCDTDYVQSSDNTTCDSASVEQDPHFLLHVPGLPLPVCYDLYGPPGQSFRLIENRESRMVVVGTLRDDNYFSDILIGYLDNRVHFDYKRVRINHRIVYSWQNVSSASQAIFPGMISDAGYLRLRMNLQQVTVIVQLVKPPSSLPFINLFVESVDPETKTLSGFLGSALMAKFKYLTSQTDDQVTFEVNKQSITAHKMVRFGETCLFVPNQGHGLYKGKREDYTTNCLFCDDSGP